jgi:hypothetical protein
LSSRFKQAIIGRVLHLPATLARSAEVDTERQSALKAATLLTASAQGLINKAVSDAAMTKAIAKPENTAEIRRPEGSLLSAKLFC